MKKIGIFCVGTGGHVLPAKNLITQLNDEGIDLDKFIIITDERGSQYLKNLDIKIYILDIYRSKIGLFGYVLNIYRVMKTLLEIRTIIKKEVCKEKIFKKIKKFSAPILVLRIRSIYV